MLSCETLTSDDLVVLNSLISQQQEEIRTLKNHVSLLLDELHVTDLNRKCEGNYEKQLIELKTEIEKLKREKAKLRQEHHGTYIAPGQQRKYNSHQNLGPRTPVTPHPNGNKLSPITFERRNTGTTASVRDGKVKTLDERDLRAVALSPTFQKSATLQRATPTTTTPNSQTFTPNSMQSRQRNKGLFASMSKAVHKVRSGGTASRTKKSVSDPNLSQFETNSNYSTEKDAPSSGRGRGWLKNIFGSKKDLRGRHGSTETGYSLLQVDKTRVMYPCMLGEHTLEELLTTSTSDLEKSGFLGWETWKLHQWMDTQGLGMFGQKLPAGWTGAKVLKLDINGLEQLGIKHPLHVKKLILALRSIGKSDEAGELKCDSWVLPWLHDIGLPQHVPAFREAMVDGRILNFLTYHDLNQLKVRLRLHAVSIMRAVELLRECNFNPNYLNRSRIDNTTRPAEVTFWSHQNVKQWLSANAYAEFTPALKESGLHGAILMREPLITSSFMLKLLRMHPGDISSQTFETVFNKLVGPHALLEKRLAETDKNVKPLNMQSKLSKSFRTRRSFQSSFSKRNRKPSDEWLTYVVPFSDTTDPDVPPVGDMSFETKEEISGIQREMNSLTVLLSSPESNPLQDKL